MYKSGFITLVGRPNAGKSSLLNAVLGKKIAITSNTAQTTRHRFRAIKTTADYQLIMVDTPGIHKSHDVLGEQLNMSAIKALDDVDAIAMLIDASATVGTGDEWVASQIARVNTPKILVLSKTDLVEKEMLIYQLKTASKLANWSTIVTCSAKLGDGIERFEREAAALLPEGPQWFPNDLETDQPLEVIIAEFIREKILHTFRDEIPHAIGVITEALEYVRKKDLYRIQAIIYVEHESQKGMVIGKAGTAIKRIGIEARKDLEHILGCRVFLDLSVKVKKNWRRDASQIRRFGYADGA